MPRYLETRGKPSLAIGICARCSCKMPYSDLREDPNYPGLFCCDDDIDVLDPWRLAPRNSERIDLDHARPDVNIYSKYPTVLYSQKPFGIGDIKPVTTWQAQTVYQQGASITPMNIDDQNVDLPQSWFLCVVPGVSGVTPPVWPHKPGQLVGTYTILVSDQFNPLLSDMGIQLLADSTNGDGTVTWLNIGLFPN